MEKVVVAGAGFAGIQAAISLGRKGFNVELIDKSSEHIYTPGLIDLVRDRRSKEDLKLDVKPLFEETSVDFFEEEITDIRPEDKVVVAEESRHYDYLVLALGGEAVIPDGFNEMIVPYTLEEASKLRNVEGSTAVIGAGYTGIEFACELSEKGIDVTVFDTETRPLKRFSEKASEKALETMISKDVKFRGGKEITGIEDSTVKYGDDSESFNHVILNIGTQPNKVVEDSLDSLETNSGLSSLKYDNIFVIGDCNGKNERTAHDAISEGKIVAENISKKDYEDLEPAKPDKPGHLLGMGATGAYINNDTVLESRIFRYLKDIVGRIYFWNLKRKAWMLKHLM